MMSKLKIYTPNTNQTLTRTNMKQILLIASVLYTLTSVAQHQPHPELDLLQDPPSNVQLIESINTVEDMIEWIRYDIKNDQVDYISAQGYVETLQTLLTRLKLLKDECTTIRK